ncbi:uncharacterized protein METZ01_LOCUS37451 [marine metagenome]|uniref:Uncharacterized protein n=1 Tax=marine metagenome TaxID=408172 RepID=A0A381R447_9ZZZZ
MLQTKLSDSSNWAKSSFHDDKARGLRGEVLKRMVEPTGIEPVTSTLPASRSPS